MKPSSLLFVPNKDKINSILFKFLTFLIPTQLSYHFWPSWSHVLGIRIDYLAPAVYLTDFLVATLVIINIRIIFNFILNHRKIFLLVFLFVTYNVLTAIVWQVSLTAWLRVLLYVLFGIYISQEKRFEIYNWLVKPFTVSLFYVIPLGILQVLKGKTIEGLFYYLGERSFNIETPGIATMDLFGKELMRSYSTFPHPNVMAVFLVVVILLLVFENKMNLKLKIPFLIFLSLGLFTSYSKTALLSLVVGCVLFLNYRFKVIVINFRKVALFIIVLILMSLSLFYVKDYFDKQNFPNYITSRVRLVRLAEPFFGTGKVIQGIGLGNFIRFTEDAVKGVSEMQPVHNQYILILVETGILGLVLLFIMFTKAIANTFRGNGKVISAVLIVICISGIFDHYWLTLNQTQLIFTIFAGLSFNKKYLKLK